MFFVCFSNLSTTLHVPIFCPLPRELGDVKSAQEHFTSALLIEPNNPKVGKQLFVCLLLLLLLLVLTVLCCDDFVLDEQEGRRGREGKEGEKCAGGKTDMYRTTRQPT